MIESSIVSFSEGRIRLRHCAFKDAAIVEELRNITKDLDGIISITNNVRTGSILVHYDPDTLPMDELSEMLQQGNEWLLQQPASCATRKPINLPDITLPDLNAITKHKNYKRAMAASLGASILALGVGTKRTHVVAGSIFLLLSLGHMWRVRRLL